MAVRLLLCVLLCPFAVSEYPEYQIKSAYLEKFSRFVEWPSQNQGRPFTVCVFGRNPFDRYLEDLVATARFNDRPTRFKWARKIEEIAEPDLLFISSSESRRVEEVLGTVRGRPVLTVGDTPGFCEKGVLINLYKTEGMVRFEVNEREAVASGLKFSSKILKLARIVGAR